VTDSLKEINLWSQETPLLNKHVPTNAQPTIEEAVFSAVRAVLVATQRALTASERAPDINKPAIV
jgi:hypothetical protein